MQLGASSPKLAIYRSCEIIQSRVKISFHNNISNIITINHKMNYLIKALLAIISAWESLIRSPFGLLLDLGKHLVPVPNATTSKSAPKTCNF